MKKILVVIAICLLNTIPALAEKNDCSGMKKLSKEYILCTAKNIKKAANILNENNYTNEDCILIVRTLLVKAKRILKLQEELKKNKNIEQVITNYKPPIFWKDKEIVKVQLNKWKTEKIKELIKNINNIELEIKKNYNNSILIVTNFILEKSRSEINN